MSKLFMMIGLPASGKSTIAREMVMTEDAEIVSSDLIRKELFGSEEVQKDNNKVFEIVHNRLIEGLEAGKNMIFDATNIDYKKRRAFLQRLNKLNVQKIAILVATPYEECLERNAKRKRKVPEEAITRMYHNFYIPQRYEGFDEIIIKYNSDYSFNVYDLEDIPQDNPHHSLKVLEHCNKVLENINKEMFGLLGIDVKIAGYLHDIGKLKTKTFVNSKGETTEIAHYYNHEKVSAYDALFSNDIRTQVEDVLVTTNDFVLDILCLIQWHMIMHFNFEEKTILKYKNMLGEEMWDKLEILHKADCEAC